MQQPFLHFRFLLLWALLITVSVGVHPTGKLDGGVGAPPLVGTRAPTIKEERGDSRDEDMKSAPASIPVQKMPGLTVLEWTLLGCTSGALVIVCFVFAGIMFRQGMCTRFPKPRELPPSQLRSAAVLPSLV
ncbi:hypothetical protein PAPYR_5549 [Paratrimastix pyriformis]|uniref:Uncharacterized protein n=1 Tax=Paratrimastix pyriformis TaxID=342808 RepID=A0ABQ8UMK8_9EUKA|nr:hypothetical protein PAPYR_5549 [Paratrimastix pyriformis]